MEITQYITTNALIFIPVLYVLGMILKGINKVPDNVIPVVLLPIGIALSIFTLGNTPEAIVQGILVTGAAVYTNQVFKQLNKED